MKIDNADNQSGTALFIMVLIFLMLSSLFMLVFLRLETQWQQQIFYEQRYYHHFNQAISALSWSLQQHWPPPTQQWYCQHLNHNQRVSCIKQSKHPGFTLIKGISDSLPLYALAVYQSDGRLHFSKGQWLDFCPEPSEVDCE
ncbi:MAG: YgdB family protein [Candidatus Schmidhempelia sp.]|nr:YgdB family protein [Candidatus Schmidhempelia sp.]